MVINVSEDIARILANLKDKPIWIYIKNNCSKYYELNSINFINKYFNIGLQTNDTEKLTCAQRRQNCRWYNRV